MSAEDALRRAAELCDRVVFQADTGVLAEADRVLDAVEAGVAANLVGLAYVAQAQQRHDDAAALLDEAETLARSVQAHRITEQVSQARTAKNPRA